MSMLFLIVLALAAGCSLSIQAGVGAQLGHQVGDHSIWATFASFAVGLVFLFPFTFLPRSDWPTVSGMTEAHWWTWLGGIVGAAYVLSTIVIAPRLGATTFFSFVIAGQIVMSLLLDQYGLIGFAPHRLSPMRFAGALLVVAGVVLVRRF